MPAPPPPPATVRRRKLAPTRGISSSLLRAWTPKDSAERELKSTKKSQPKKKEPVVEGEDENDQEEAKPRRTRVELRTRKSKVSSLRESLESKQEDEQEYVSAREEVSIIEDISMFDESFHSCESEEEQQGESGNEGSYTERGSDVEEDSDFDLEPAPSKAPATEPKRTERLPRRDLLGGSGSATNRDSAGERKAKAKNLEDRFLRLRLDEIRLSPPSSSTMTTPTEEPASSPPSTPPKEPRRQKGLVSPTKLPRIPNTPHRPSTDMFWSQEFVEDWNDQHSPVKQLFPDPKPSKPPPTKSKFKANPPIPPPSPAKKTASEKQAQKAFDSTKESLALDFLHLLDTRITSSQLSSLSSPTGGIKILWSKTLATTAGRANWKRETIRPSSSSITPTIKHHCSIELSTKVITTPHRLYNVLAHEFCHLCNFMISNITTNPHGKEFKSWGAKVTREFGESHGIEVTTKHSYEIDFKYVWSCVECGMEFKRHSKSIDVARHRCGGCKGVLRQIRPTPRGGGTSAAATENSITGGETSGQQATERKQSAYQIFMKDEMKRVRQEQPGLQQKEVMKVVAERWKVEKERDGGMSAAPRRTITETKKELPVRQKKKEEEIEVVDLT
ncbi:SprT-like family-domain-containing protein [Triangularia setosa]|uniref:SprT-like family-domain-containing protein n=1 Tax=Triangularia setosa TaxID=2587417 RepID=A0AAN7A9P7_9PEZI|nr:SprT-like family-domain-containing protein [Podospora setosa]